MAHASAFLILLIEAQVINCRVNEVYCSVAAATRVTFAVDEALRRGESVQVEGV